MTWIKAKVNVSWTSLNACQYLLAKLEKEAFLLLNAPLRIRQKSRRFTVQFYLQILLAFSGRGMR